MKLSVLLAGLALIATTTTAIAAQGPYLGLSGGVTITHDSDLNVSGLPTITASYDAGAAVNVAAGMRFDNARVELEYGYKNADVDRVSGPGGSASINTSDISVNTYMINALYDFDTKARVSPFVGAGIGILNGEIEDSGAKLEDTVFGYQLMAGLSFKAAKNVNLDLSYRFVGAAADLKDSGASLSYNSSNVLAGIRYSF